MHHSNLFSFIGFFKPIQLSTITPKLFNSIVLSQQVTHPFLLTLSQQEMPVDRPKNNLIYWSKYAVEGKDVFFATPGAVVPPLPAAQHLNLINFIGCASKFTYIVRTSVAVEVYLPPYEVHKYPKGETYFPLRANKLRVTNFQSCDVYIPNGEKLPPSLELLEFPAGEEACQLPRQIHITSSTFPIQENNLMEEAQFESSFIFQRYPFVANLSYLKNYTHKYKKIIKHTFFKLFVKKIKEFKYIFKNPLTQTLTTKLVGSLFIYSPHNIKNFIHLVNLKILQVLIFCREFFSLEQMPLKQKLLKNEIKSFNTTATKLDLPRYQLFKNFNMCMPKRGKNLSHLSQQIFFKFSKIKEVCHTFLKCVNSTYSATYFFLIITHSNWFAPKATGFTPQTQLNKSKLAFKCFSTVYAVTNHFGVSKNDINLLSYGVWKPTNNINIRRKEAVNKCYNANGRREKVKFKGGSSLTTFFLNLKNFLVHLVLYVKKFLNQILWKWSKTYKKKMTYSKYLQKSTIFIDKINYFYIFDSVL